MAASGHHQRLARLHQHLATASPSAAATYSTTADALKSNTVGVVAHDASRASPGYTLFSSGMENYLIDNDGQMCHKWVASRGVNVAYLLPNGDLLRDGSEDTVNTLFRAGGAAGYVEQVSWEGERVWSFSYQPYDQHLTHHDIEYMPNGNVLLLAWNRREASQLVGAGRRPELLPDGQLWVESVLEIQPNGRGGADIVWEWDLWDHLVQDYDEAKDNYGNVVENPQLMDVNFVVGNPRGGNRNGSGDSQRGVKDWTHVNAISYNPELDQIMLSYNTASELNIIDHSTTTEEAKGHSGGRYGKGGDFLYRFGNPATMRGDLLQKQSLYNQHNTHWIPNGSNPAYDAVPGHNGTAGSVLLFNNGRVPDREWTTVDEFLLPELPPDAEGGGGYERAPQSQAWDEGGFKQADHIWSFGESKDHNRSFYSTHISGVQRVSNGNTLITMGPQGIMFEVTPEGEEVWRYINPVSTLHCTALHCTMLLHYAY
jgi:hypothetical protein